MRTAIALAILVMASLAAFGVVKAQKSGNPTHSAATARAPAAPAERTPPASPVQTVAAAPESVVVAQAQPRPQMAPLTATAATPAAVQATPAPPPVAPAPTCANPNALGVSRVVEIDTTGGPGFGFEHFKGYDFLKPGEVVLTFDDGPWLNHTPMVLKALADQCVKAVFFPIGKHATYYPEILRQVAEEGHTIGSHTWSHQDLSKKSVEDAKEEIEKGISAVKWALNGTASAPFFRFPALRHPPELVTYLGERNIAIFSTDLDSFDFKLRKGDQVVKSVMDKLKKHGKGIVLMHDFQASTAHAVADLLNQLKAGGFKVVQMKAKDPVQSIAQYDEMMMKEQKLPTVAAGRPMSSVIKTIAGE
jgi:peptidoglycan/xylan/chitin deacetylase (PgdA/CDA1 family)